MTENGRLFIRKDKNGYRGASSETGGEPVSSFKKDISMKGVATIGAYHSGFGIILMCR
jgi:hypothetical protein